MFTRVSRDNRGADPLTDLYYVVLSSVMTSLLARLDGLGVGCPGLQTRFDRAAETTRNKVWGRVIWRWVSRGCEVYE